MPNPNVAEAFVYWRCSSKENNIFCLWRSHKVLLKFVHSISLWKSTWKSLRASPPKEKMFCTLKLNMICTSLNAFVKTTVTEINTEVITEYRMCLLICKDHSM